MGAAIEDETKYKVLTKHWSPPSEFVFPKVARAETSATQTKYFRFQSLWLAKNKWLVSVAYAGFLKEGGGGGGRKFRKFEINEHESENFPAQNQVRIPAPT